MEKEKNKKRGKQEEGNKCIRELRRRRKEELRIGGLSVHLGSPLFVDMSKG